MLDFISRQWLAIVLVLAIVASIYVAYEQAGDEAALVRTKAIEVCADTSGAAALVVAFKEEIARRAEKRDEKESAVIYRALARGGADLIPLPANAQDERDTIADITKEGDKYVLSPRARALIVRGCIEAYDPKAFEVRQDR